PPATRGLAAARARRAAGERFEAAAHAAAAHDLASARLDVDVADVARRALRAAVNPPVDDDACADPGADLDEDEVVDAATASSGELAERHHVDVVVDPDRGAAGGEAPAHVVAVPAGH